MEVSVEVDKIIKCAIYNTVFFPSGGDDVLMRLSLIKQIIKDVNLMCISFSVKHPQIFWESWMSLSNMSRTISNMYTYPFNPKLVIKTLVENHDKKPKDQRNFYMWTIIFQMDGCISVLVRWFFNWSMRICSEYKLFILSRLCILLSICYSF